jgi:hypothetical protein
MRAVAQNVGQGIERRLREGSIVRKHRTGRNGLPAFSRRRCLAASWLLAALLWPAGYLPAQTRQEQGRQFVDQALAALGGDAFLKIRNTMKTGRAYSFYREDLRGLAVITVYDRYEPMKEDAGPAWLPVSHREVYTEKGDYYTLFQNGKGWEVTYRGARPLHEERLQRHREATRRDIFYFLRYRLQEPGLYFYYRGVEIIDNVPADAVEITDSDSETITVYFRRSDHLPIQQIYTRRDPKTRIPYEETSVFSKFRKVGEVTLPWNVRQERDGEKVFELFGASIEVNQNLSDDLFRLQQGLSILPESP